MKNLNWKRIAETSGKVLFFAGKTAVMVCAVALAVILVPLIGGGFGKK